MTSPALEDKIGDLIVRVGTEFKAVRVIIGSLANLTTTAKGDIVSAINEIEAQVAALSGNAAGINDAATANNSTWSSNKITAFANNAATTAANLVKNDLLNGAGAAYDTLKELGDLIQGEASQISDIMTALGNRLRTDVANQGLTEQQRVNGRTNLDVYSKAEIGDVTTDLVAAFNNALA